MRENVIIGNGVVAGNSCEFKNCLIFDEAQVPHFSYVGSSILGHKAHLGAGVILSNVKLDHYPDQRRRRGRAIHLRPACRSLAPSSVITPELGCNAVLSPRFDHRAPIAVSIPACNGAASSARTRLRRCVSSLKPVVRRT